MRLILTILLIGLFKANAQIVINASAPYRPMAVAGVESGFAAGYSLRKLKDGYTGSAIRVRKDTTGQPEQDIGFLGNHLDTASLKSFLNARSGFVVKWYNQGDSSTIDFEQTTQASQPRIANLGVIDRQNGKPAIIFDGSNDFMDVPSSTNRFNYLHNGTVGFISIVARFGTGTNPNVGYFFLDNKAGSGISRGYTFWYDDRSSITRNNAYALLIGNGSQTVVSNIKSDEITPNTQVLITQINDPSNATAANRNIGYVNNGNAINTNTATNSINTLNAPENMRLGRISNSTTFSLLGSVQEIILWNSNKSSQRTTIQNEINSFYSIY